MSKDWFRHNTYKLMLKALPISDNTIGNVLSNCQIAFVISTGRTGTKWLSEILSHIEGNITVHEPVPIETFAHRQAVYNQDKADRYIKVVKRKDICLRILRNNSKHYTEVNGILRRHIPFLKIYFPHANFIHVVRDGRPFVRSLLARGTYRGKHPVYGEECPLTSKALRDSWHIMREFEKACWVWKEENENIRNQIYNLARLEEFTASYSAFCAQILRPLGLSLSESVWKKYANEKVNASKMNETNIEDEWTDTQNEIFNSICGIEMKALGYY